VPERDVAVAESSERPASVLVSVGFSEGVLIAQTLRDHGVAVIGAPSDVLAHPPHGPVGVLVLDVDPPRSLDALERLRDLYATAEVVCIGDAGRAADLGIAVDGGRHFERPLDVEQVVLSVLRLATVDGEGIQDVRSRSPYPKEGDTAAPVAGPGTLAPPADPGVAENLDAAGLFPPFDDPENADRRVPPEPSPELAALLRGAEQRLHASGGLETAPVRPAENDSLRLAAYLVAVLDEPLDPEDEPSSSGASTRAGTGNPLRVTSAEAVSRAISPEPARPNPTPDAGGGLRTSAPPAVQATSPLPAPLVSVAQVQPLPALSSPVASARLSSSGPSSAGEESSPWFAMAPPVVSSFPNALREEGDAVKAITRAVAARATGALTLGQPAELRRVLLREGDIVTVVGELESETLVAFLVSRGDLARNVAARLQGKLPPFGRHAGAALIAHGHLGQEDLWPILRAHAEWILGRALLADEGMCALDIEPRGRLKAEPSVFGGSTGAEVVIEAVRRAIAPDVAVRRLGGPSARLADGQELQLLPECALSVDEEDAVRGARGRTVAEVLAGKAPELANVLYALAGLSVLEALAPSVPTTAVTNGFDPLDAEALRQRVRLRMAVIEDGDYFALLGVPKTATGYEIRRAYLDLRRAFEPGRVLTAATADLAVDLQTVIEVLDEAYDILREPSRRDRYRRAIEAGPP
jgi:hypothetical protein